MKMCTDFRRKLAMLMAGCLVLGSIQLTEFTVQAAPEEENPVVEETKTGENNSDEELDKDSGEEDSETETSEDDSDVEDDTTDESDTETETSEDDSDVEDDTTDESDTETETSEDDSNVGSDIADEEEGSTEGTYSLKDSTTETEVTYRLSDLVRGNCYGVIITPKGTKETQFHFEGQYKQVNYAIPQEVKEAGLIKFTCNLTSGSKGTLAVKYLNAEEAQVGVGYGRVELSVGESDDQKEVGYGADGLEYIGLMNNAEGENDITISSITFTVSKPVANPPVYDDDDDEDIITDVTYRFNDLDLGKYYGVDITPKGSKETQFHFKDRYQQANYAIPQAVKEAGLIKVTCNITSGSGNLSLKLINEAQDKDVKVVYGPTSISVGEEGADGLGYVGLMSLPEGESDITISSLTFTVRKQVANPPSYDDDPDDEDENGKDHFYRAETLKAYERWSGTQVEPNDGKLILSYSKQWNEYCLDLPEVLDMSNCENITIKTADQNATLAFKVYNKTNPGNGDEPLRQYYGNSGKDEYSFVPDFTGKAACIGIMSSDANTNEAGDAYESPCTVQIVSIEFTMNGNGEEIELGDNLIKNPNFADADNLAVWGAGQGSSTITAEVAGEAIFDDIKTYGKITNRGSNYNCFAQDITDAVVKNKEYQYTFYVMLDADDYKDTADEMRTVAMAPYITADGKANYSCNLTGNSQQVLEPGVWTKFSGTFTPSWTGELDNVVIRILEQGTEYGSGPGVKGTYYATGVDLREMIVPEKEIQKDVPNLKDKVTEEMGNDFIMGVSIVNSELSDDLLMQLVTKHFNAVTPGNELKPDAMFGYASTCPGTDTATINGQTIQVPKLDYRLAEMTLDAIYDWNQEHPKDFIKIRGHVLVWHSQTPEWFFHEDYDANKPYVSKDTMNLRLEWYIKTMAEHFTGSGSKYKDMFYGWDVVNEAVSDSTGTYRSDKENSSWWAVYQSNEFILNAFTYANKYMPASVELYYNDYNEWFTNKRNGIVQLLKDVKAKEGARIDGMGMQAHYQTNGSPTVEEFEAAARAYCEVVGQVQITELDMAASSSYDGTTATLEAEYAIQAKRYEDIYTSVRRMKAEGYRVGNITIWGVIDKNSWLQSSSSVGGGTDGTRKQCPLLFDDNYQVKPSYWVFIDPEPLTPAIHKLTVVQTAKESFAYGVEQTYTRNGITVSFVPVWNDKGISVQVKVADKVKDAEDKVTLYLAKADGTIVSAECLRANAEETGDGYTAVVSSELDSSLLKVAAKVGFDIVVTDGSQKAAYNDTTLSQATSSEYYAIATLKPHTYIPMGTAEVDGEKESSWDEAVTIPLTIRLGAEASAQASLMWDQEYLYVFAEIKDSNLDAASSQAHEQDSLEIFIDENNHKSVAYEDDDKQYRINYLNEHSFNGPQCKEENIVSEAKTTEDGYVIEMAIKWTDIKPANNMAIGIELQINDAAGGKRIGTLSWYDESGQGWSSPGVFGTAVLRTTLEEPDTPQKPEEPDTPQKTEEPSTPQNPSSGQDNSSKGPGSAAYEVIADWDQITADLYEELSALTPNATECGVLTVITGNRLIVPVHVMQMMIDKKMVLNMGVREDFSFSIVGLDIPSDIMRDLDLSVAESIDVVPAAVIENACRDAISYRQLSMLNRGRFDVTVNLHVALGMENAGKYANLYRYDAETGKMIYMDSFMITDIGQAVFEIMGGADFVVTVTNAKPMSDDPAEPISDDPAEPRRDDPVVPKSEYTVVKGDTLSKIANRFLVNLEDLIKANPQIKNINRISVGDKIYLP